MIKTQIELIKSLPIGFKTKVEVITNSMSPKILPGESVVLKITPFEKIKNGDIIVFYTNNFKRIIAHRVIKIDGKKITTKGDNCAIEDKLKVSSDMFLGKILGVKRNYLKRILKKLIQND